MRPSLIVAALSARMLAESARDAGFDVVALDVFGDRDTRDAAVEWRSIAGDGGALRIDGARLAAALGEFERRDGSAGWIYGAGVEPHLAGACAAAPALPLIGNPPEVVAAVRDPAKFFAVLRDLGIAFPETRLDAPADPAGWLRKDFAGSGGWHVHHASTPGAAAARLYWQRLSAGDPLSALFVADGRDARVLGVQRQLVAPLAGRPFVFRGVVGPVAIDSTLRSRIDDSVARCVKRFGLRGLGSADFLIDAGATLLLEINPRPTASVALHDRGGSMLRAHLDGCRGGALAATPRADGVRGFEVVYAAKAARVGARLAPAPWRHDLPAVPTEVAPGDPVCSVSAHAADEAQVLALLAERRHDVDSALEMMT